MYRVYVLILSLLALILTQASAVAAPEIRLLIDDRALALDHPPFIEEGRTMVPVRALAAALGFDVQYEPENRVIILARPGLMIQLWVNSQKALVNFREERLDVAPIIRGDRTFVPLRFIAERMGASASWDGPTRTIRVTTGAAKQLFEAASQRYQAGPPNQQITGQMQMSAILRGSPDHQYETTLDFDLHIYNQEALCTITTQISADGATQAASTAEMAVKDGHLYMKTSTPTDAWQSVGLFDWHNGSILPTQLGQQLLLAPLFFGADLYPSDSIVLNGHEMIDGIETTGLVAWLPSGALDSLFERLIIEQPVNLEAPLPQLIFSPLTLRLWVNPETGFTHRIALDFSFTMTVPESEQAPVQRVLYKVHGDLHAVSTAEPINFASLP